MLTFFFTLCPIIVILLILFFTSIVSASLRGSTFDSSSCDKDCYWPLLSAASGRLFFHRLLCLLLLFFIIFISLFFVVIYIILWYVRLIFTTHMLVSLSFFITLAGESRTTWNQIDPLRLVFWVPDFPEWHVFNPPDSHGLIVACSGKDPVISWIPVHTVYDLSVTILVPYPGYYFTFVSVPEWDCSILTPAEHELLCRTTESTSQHVHTLSVSPFETPN